MSHRVPPRRSAPGLLALLLALSIAVAGAPPATAAGAVDAAALRAALAPLVEQGGVAVGENGRPAFVYRPGAYVPASIIKLATALAAFHELGADYRFRTEVYADGERIYVRGYGDPFLVSEEWALIAGELAAAGAFAHPLEALVLDGSAFAAELEVDGASNSPNPYDAKLGALVANFNTVFVAVSGAGTVTSAEPQTPLTPLAQRLGAALPEGQHRINLTAQGVAGIAYAGELAQAVFTRAGAHFRGPALTGRVPADLRPLRVHRSSRTLGAVVAGMLEYSNNFVANQLVLALALDAAGEPARLEPGLERVRRYLREQLGLGAERFHLREGSGLSRQNRIELTDMLRVVDAFHPWADLLKPYGRPPLEVPAKTGTLTGVYTLAGFLPAPEGVRRPFVIMLNQQRHTRGAVFRQVARAFSAGGRPAAAVR